MIRPRVTYADRQPRKSGYLTQTILDRFNGDRRAAFAWLDRQDQEKRHG